MSIHMHQQVPPPGFESRIWPAASEARNAEATSRPSRKQAVRFESGLHFGDSPRDAYESSVPNRTKDKLRRFGQNAMGVGGLLLTCCLMPCSRRA